MPPPRLDTARGRYDAIVIGAGPNGLAAAITLARAGWRTLVVERNPTLGGGARSAELTLPSFIHDTCSAIHPLGIGSPFLQSLPLHEHGLEWVHPTIPLAHPFDDGSAAALHRDISTTAATFDDARDARTYARIMSGLVDHWDAFVADGLAPPHLPRHPLVMARYGWHAGRSAASLARRWFRGRRGRGLFAGLAGHSVLPLDEMPSAAIGVVLMVAARAVGWPFPRGGAQRIADAMVSYLRQLGGELVTGIEVSTLERLPEARAVLFDTAPRNLAAIAGEALPAGYRHRLMRFRHGPGVFKVDWALAGPIPWRAETCRQAGTVHVGGSFEGIAAGERAVWQGEHPAEPFILLAQQRLFDDTRAPAGQHTGWAYCHVPAGSTRDMTDALEARIEHFAPGFRDRFLARHTRGPAELQRHNPNLIGGDVTGGTNTLSQLIARPVLGLDPYATPNRKLYLCSASTPPGAGVHGLCGHSAAQSALRRA